MLKGTQEQNLDHRSLSLELIRLLLQANARDAAGKYTVTPEKISALIQKGASIEAKISARGFNGSTPLMLAAHYNRPDLAEILLKAKANVNVFDGNGNNALMIYLEKITAQTLSPRFLKMLVDRGIKSDHVNLEGNNALMLAVNALPSDNSITIKVINLLLSKMNEYEKLNALQQMNSLRKNCYYIALEKESKIPKIDENSFSVAKQLNKIIENIKNQIDQRLFDIEIEEKHISQEICKLKLCNSENAALLREGAEKIRNRVKREKEDKKDLEKEKNKKTRQAKLDELTAKLSSLKEEKEKLSLLVPPPLPPRPMHLLPQKINGDLLADIRKGVKLASPTKPEFQSKKRSPLEALFDKRITKSTLGEIENKDEDQNQEDDDAWNDEPSQPKKSTFK